MPALARSVADLAAYRVEGLAGHMQPVLRRGGESIASAHAVFSRLGVPESIG